MSSKTVVSMTIIMEDIMTFTIGMTFVTSGIYHMVKWTIELCSHVWLQMA
jgi:hypothetical protein